MLSQLNKETQSDKGTHHSYIDMYYEETLANYKDKTITLLEIGVNAGRSLELWANPLIDTTTATSDFNLHEFKITPHTVYVGLTPDNISRLKPLMNMFYQHVLLYILVHPFWWEPKGNCL